MKPFPRSSFRLHAWAAAALLAGAGASAQAQSSVQVYGLFDVSVGQFQNAGGGKFRRLDSGNMTTSYWGVKSSEDLGGNLKAQAQLEGFVLVDAGLAGRVSGVDAFWARNAWVGLSGDFGSVKLGRSATPLFVSTLVFNPYGDSFGYAPAIRQYFAAPYGTPVVGDTAWSNALAYGTPRIGGFSANLLFAMGEHAATAKGNNIGANAMWFGGPVAVTAAWQKVKAQGVLGRSISAFPGYESQTAWQLGASYDLQVTKLFAQLGSIKTDATADVTTSNLQLGASVPVGAGAVLAAVGRSRIETQGSSTEPRSTMLTLGYDHRLSKRTDVYAILMHDRYTALANGNTFALGLRHTF
ncbi:MAG: porin [Rubrivivax sp.]